MTEIVTLHQNSEGLAKGLLPYIQTALPSTTCRPWNRFDSQETEWLLSPVREWPLVRPCKYYTAMSRAEDPTESQLVGGIYVEKGRTGDAAKMSKGNECMDARWGWHAVVKGFHSHEIPEVLEALPDECRGQVEVQVSGGYPEDTFGTYRVRVHAPDGSAPFTVDAEAPVPHLAAVGRVTSWDEFAASLEALSTDDWLWVDMYIRIRLLPTPRVGEPRANVWTDQQLWNEFLESFLPWVTPQ